MRKGRSKAAGAEAPASGVITPARTVGVRLPTISSPLWTWNWSIGAWVGFSREISLMLVP